MIKKIATSALILLAFFSTLFVTGAGAKQYWASEIYNKSEDRITVEGGWAEWRTGGWSGCNKSCGGGSQSRGVWCENNKGQTVDNSYCSTLSQPTSSSSCNTQACAPVGGGGEGGGGGSCFLAGTQITMADGSTKNIEDVQPGDKIFSYSPENNQSSIETVNIVSSPIRNHHYIVTLEDGTILKITEDHPMYVRNGNHEGWASLKPNSTKNYVGMVIDSITKDSKILNEQEQWIAIKSIKRIEGDVQAYNLHNITNTHTFFANGLLAHNYSVYAGGSSGGAGAGPSCGSGSGG